MSNVLCFEDITGFLPFLAVPFVIMVFIAIVISTVIKRVKEEDRKRAENASKAEYPFTLDGNGRTEHQRDYLNAKRRELSERKVQSADKSHSHTGGTVENYDRIVGSLGEHNDEGCDELDGIRLIEHDEAYCDDPDHLMPTDNEDIQKAIVLGEILNTPRYKQPYHRK